jgi:predicted ATPase
MKITNVSIENFRSISNIQFGLSEINLIVGQNNSGKSSIIRAIYSLQKNQEISAKDIRLNHLDSKIELVVVSTATQKNRLGASTQDGVLKIHLETDTDKRAFTAHVNFSDVAGEFALGQLPDRAPEHFIVPLLSKRKSFATNELFKSEDSRQINANFSMLSAKVAMVCNESHPAYSAYKEACKNILGFVVTSVLSDGGQRPGIYADASQAIHIDQMGEGVAHIVGIIADIAVSENKMFLIEEPESDLHPSALKAILELIVMSSKTNQFIISTHSNIVVTYLGALESTSILKVQATFDKLPPTSTIETVDRRVESRLSLLRELGYSLSDLELWDGWLILEESSAERIIRDYLIPWFAPKLSRIRTISASSISQVEANFEDLNRLVRFTHLEEVYKDAVWVRVDGDSIGKDTCQKLQARYKAWKSDRFDYFDQAQFERFYPEEFQVESDKVLAIQDRKAKRAAKDELLTKVRGWLDGNEEQGRKALERSATNVISHLQKIEAQMLKRSD